MSKSKIMNEPAKSALEHTECRHMALALEGLAGAVHSGHQVKITHLQSAGKAAEDVWEAGPEPGALRDSEFRTARRIFKEASVGCVAGRPKEGAALELAAQRMALELRWMARDLASKQVRKPAPQVEDLVERLQAEYGRYGLRLELKH